MRLLVGLGNPGTKYEKNRHNVGFLLLDKIIEAYGLTGGNLKYNALSYSGVVHGEKAIAIKPQTYMNNSGGPVSGFTNFYKVDPSDVMVFYDDLDLALGKVRVRIGGSDGGHNGIKSLNSHIKNEYTRVRIGIGHPGDKDLVNDHVLTNFSKDEFEIIEKIAAQILKYFDLLMSKDYEGFSGKVNEL